jgi:hypothetical protein
LKQVKPVQRTVTDANEREDLLIKLYMDITGQNESAARAVFLYVCSERLPCCGHPTRLDSTSEPIQFRLNPSQFAFPELHKAATSLRAATAP